VYALSKWLENSRNVGKSLQVEIDKLENKIARLRQESQKHPGVFDEIRLNGLLNNLRDELQKNSAFQHQCLDKQTEFEQKALSLVSLYNDRIVRDLDPSEISSESGLLNYRLNE